MDIPSKDENSVDDLNNKLDSFLAEDFEICPEKPPELEFDIEKEIAVREDVENRLKDDCATVINEAQPGSTEDDKKGTEEKFKKMKVDKELEELKKRTKDSMKTTKTQEVNDKSDLISDNDLSSSLDKFLRKLNNSK